MQTRNLPSKNEDYSVIATIFTDGNEIANIPCKIYLPERISEKPFLVLKPSEETLRVLESLWKVGLKSKVIGFSGKTELIIESPEVYFLEANTNHWGKELSESTISCDPQDLQIITPFVNNEGINAKKTILSLWLSPNILLSPDMMVKSSFDGNVECEYIRKLSFTFSSNIKHVFLKHFCYKKESNNDTRRWSFLVSSCEVDLPATATQAIKHEILTDLDDFLLLSSFAARQRTGCMGWQAQDEKNLVEFYRGNYSFPKNRDISLNDTLIDLFHFEGFANKAYKSFLKYNNKLALRSSLHASVNARDRKLEQSFLSTFAGLESLILDFKREERIEHILPDKEFDKLRNYLKKCIKKSVNPCIESDKRSSIYKKLGELNRVSLSEAYDLFCSKYAIDNNDLWPLFGANKMIGLSDIRNRIIHGDPFSNEKINAIITANIHLQFTLERCVLNVLGWDLELSNVNKSFLANNSVAIQRLGESQKVLVNI